MITDTHAHLDALDESYSIDDYLSTATEYGVQRMVAIGGLPEGNRFALECAERYPLHIRAAIGYDRDYAGKLYDRDALLMDAKKETCVAIGETGLDYHYTADTADEQKVLFQDMLSIAAACRKAVVIHSREADRDTLEILGRHAASGCVPQTQLGILHCFTGSINFARQLVELGYLISFSGILTFRNADDLRHVARSIPEDFLLVETDAPYLAPVPLRGNPNQPAYVKHVLECLAECRGWTLDYAARLTSENASRVFNWPLPA
jgi:TatD DNase family protein